MSAPKLRFKEFDGCWLKSTLGQVSKVYDGTHQTPNYVDQGIKFVSVENIDAPYASDKFITKEAFEKDFKNKPQVGDILMTRITAGVIGATALVHDKEPLAYYVSLALIRPKENLYTPFLNQYISTPFFKRELHKRIIHVAFPKKINLGDINECKVVFSPLKTEQTKIAAFLSTVDEKISQLTQKHQLLSQYKQGMMQKLFSQQLRFKADDGSEFGEWVEAKFGDIASKVGSGSTPRGGAEAYTMDGIIFIRSQNVNNDQLLLSDVVYIPEEIHKKMSGSKVIANDILLNITGASIGRSCVVPQTFTEANVNQHVCIIRTPNDNPRFIQSFLSSKAGQDLIDSHQTGSGREGLNFQSIRSFIFQRPCLEEQTKIANFLSAIDQKIEVVAQQIEQAKTWKKGLLQQMFV